MKNMFDVNEMANSIEQAQKQFFDGMEQMVKFQNTAMTNGVKAWKDGVNQLNDQISKNTKV